jgi:hypothetical protein
VQGGRPGLAGRLEVPAGLVLWPSAFPRFPQPQAGTPREPELTESFHSFFLLEGKHLNGATAFTAAVHPSLYHRCHVPPTNPFFCACPLAVSRQPAAACCTASGGFRLSHTVFSISSQMLSPALHAWRCSLADISG